MLEINARDLLMCLVVTLTVGNNFHRTINLARLSIVND